MAVCTVGLPAPFQKIYSKGAIGLTFNPTRLLVSIVLRALGLSARRKLQGNMIKSTNGTMKPQETPNINIWTQI